jgi:hypothetical protein
LFANVTSVSDGEWWEVVKESGDEYL